MAAYAGSQREQERYLSKYERAHADNFASLRNVDEDDVSLPDMEEGMDGGDMKFDDMRKDFGAFMGLDEDGDTPGGGFEMPTRAQRSQAFNEELDVRASRSKGDQGADELPAMIIEDGDSDGDPFGDLDG